MSNQRYPEEFKIQAVNQVTEKKLPVAEIATRLGVSTHSLYVWIKRHSNGMAESLVKTIKREYVAHMPNRIEKRRRATWRLALSITTSSIRTALKYRLPGEFRHLAASSI